MGVLGARPGLVATNLPVPVPALVATQLGGVRRFLGLVSLLVVALVLLGLGGRFLVFLGGRARS